MKLKVKKIADGWAVVDTEENDKRVYGPFSTQEAAESELKSSYSVNFAAWQTMSKDQRVKCVEDVGYPTGFAKQWANRDFTSLPADIKAGLLANGYFKQFVAEQNPVQFGGQYKYPNEDEVWAKINEAGRKIWLNKAGVSNNQTMHGYTHNWDWEKLPAATQNKLAEALSSIPPEHLGFAASDATKFGNAAENYADNRRREFQDVWENDASNEQVRKWLKQAGLGKQYAEMGWSSLPQEVINKLKSVMDLSNYEKSGHLFSARNFAAFETLTKLASDLLKSGAAESDVRNALKAQGCTDENQQREVLAAARSYESKENFAASENDTAVWWNGKSESEKVGKLRKLFPDEDDADHQEVAAQAWKDLPLPVRRALTELHTRSTYSANSDTMKPGGKFSAKFGSRKEAQAEWNSASKNTRRSMLMEFDAGNIDELVDQKWGDLPDDVQAELAKQFSAGLGGASLNGPGLKQDVVNDVLTNPARFAVTSDSSDQRRSQDIWADMDEGQREKALKAAGLPHGVNTAWGQMLPHEWQKLVRAMTGLGYADKHFAAETGHKKASPADDRWKDSRDRRLLETYDKAGGGEAGLKAVVASGLEPNIERAKSIVERLQKERHGGFAFASKFTASLPTEDETKPEVKQFDTAAQAVDYLADHGYVNDRARAVARVDATGKWSAPSGASVVKCGAQSDPRGYSKARWDKDKRIGRNRIDWLRLVGVTTPFEVAEVIDKDWDSIPESLQTKLINKISTGSTTPD